MWYCAIETSLLKIVKMGLPPSTQGSVDDIENLNPNQVSTLSSVRISSENDRRGVGFRRMGHPYGEETRDNMVSRGIRIIVSTPEKWFYWDETFTNDKGEYLEQCALKYGMVRKMTVVVETLPGEVCTRDLKILFACIPFPLELKRTRNFFHSDGTRNVTQRMCCYCK